VAIPAPEAVTALLDHARRGDRDALDHLVPIIYGELRRVAARQMRRESSGRTLQTTALVHEAFLRLFKDQPPSFASRAHFLGIAARAMREILIERARARDAAKRGGHRDRVTLDEGMLASEARPVDFLALDVALERLALLDRRQAAIVELRFFGGLTVEETAEAVGLSPATVKREWTAARAWLYRELSGDKTGSPPPEPPSDSRRPKARSPKPTA
jgi:RNA polymerase sigma factor (TIGR02999 family)